MDLTNDAAQPPLAGGKTALRARRKPVPRTQAEQSPPRRIAMWIILTLIVGMGLGALLAKLRYHAKEALFSVNGDVIYEDYFRNRVEEVAGVETAREIELEDLWLQFARQQGVAPTDAEIDAKMAENMKQPDFQETLQKQRQSEEDYRRGLSVQMAQANLYSRGVTVTDEEVRQFYQHNIDKNNLGAVYYTPVTVQLAVIMTQTEAQARAASAKLAQGNAFEVVARGFSQDGSREYGGLINPIVRGRSNFKSIPGFEEAAFSLKAGETLGPRKFVMDQKGTAFWWILRCVDRIPEHTESFESVKQDCTLGARLVKGAPLNSSKVLADFAVFRTKASIQAFHPDFAPVVKIQK